MGVYVGHVNLGNITVSRRQTAGGYTLLQCKVDQRPRFHLASKHYTDLMRNTFTEACRTVKERVHMFCVHFDPLTL